MDLPMHVQFFIPILNVLRSLGGSATFSELKDALAAELGLTEADLEERLRSGILRVENKIRWSRLYLERAGLVEVSSSGVWTLTPTGLSREFSAEEVHSLFKTIHGAMISGRGKGPATLESDADINGRTTLDHQAALLGVLKSLPPAGFERLCQRLLRTAGFKRVIVLGRSGDGGIDGEGLLEINPLVTIKVLFQAKRYRDAVSSSLVREFRGALQGRAEKGILITTGRFTSEAAREAIREGGPPIELVDGDKLVGLFETHQLGLNPRTIYEIDESFFDEYRADEKKA